MGNPPKSEAKRRRLNALSNANGVIDALAMDQRKSLRRMIAEAAAVNLDEITAAQLSEFKCAVTRVLSPHASAVLLDPEFGSEAFASRAAGCGLLMAYEADGYENPRPYRMLALLPHISVRRLRDMGADGVKILLSYTPFDDEAANEEKRVLIERIGNECDALDMPFFLEPVGYDPDGLEPGSIEYARRKPAVVIHCMEEFSKPVYKVDVLKVEFPVNAAFVEGSAVYLGKSAYSRSEALDIYKRADAAAGACPYIYLSAGVGAGHFVESLRLAAQAEVRFSGVLCGRATWRKGVPVYAEHGAAGLERWLVTEGVQKVQAINRCLEAATPWHARVS